MTADVQLSRKEEAALSLFQLLKPEIVADPYPLYHRIREYEPVHWDPFLHSWVVTTYADVVTVLSRFKAARTPTPEQMEQMGLGVLGPYAEMMLKQLLFMDAPDHTRIRSVCAVAFAPKRIAILREAIQKIADDLVGRVAPLGIMDLVADFAGQFPSLMLTALIGLPPTDHQRIRTWAANFGELVGNSEHDPDRIPQLARSLKEFKDYISAEIIAQQTNPRDGVISTLVAAEVDGARLTHEEILANVILLIGGGSDETTNLIANGMFSLLQRPAQQAQLAAHPEIMQSAVEEFLRFESTTQYTGRVAPEDTVLGGQLIRKGQAVTAVLAAANRDPARFPDPDTLDLTRADNRHVAFSWASHYCLGAPLVRMAAAIAFSTLLRSLPNLTLVSSHPKWRGMAAMRSIQSLHVAFTPGSAIMEGN
jgi:pimeloyl-[acyl-carrier protein] synthase